MIIKSFNDDIGLCDYGIEIPIKSNRAKKVLNTLVDKYGTDIYVTAENIALTKKDLLLVHNLEYVNDLFNENVTERVMSCYELVDERGNYFRFNPNGAKYNLAHLAKAMLIHTHGTYQAAKSSLASGFSYYLGGGMHHAMSFSGRGFCLVNDLMIAIRKLQSEGLIKKAWVIDVDAHKGDGTAELSKNDDSVGTLSIHMAKGWPLDMPDSNENAPWLIPSTVDIPIESGEEGQYLQKLAAGMEEILFKVGYPDLVIIVNGADPYEKDLLPSSSLLNLSKVQMLERDKFLFDYFNKKNIPQAYTMAGGYGSESFEVYCNFLSYYLSR